MRLQILTAALTGFALLALAGAPASASTFNKKTYLTVNETIEVPGAILPPGEYVIKLVDSQATRHIVQFLNETEDEVLSTVIAIPNRRLEPTGDTEFAWYETPAGQPAAMRAWFYPGDNFGQEFAYPDDRAAELAAGAKRNVMQTAKLDPATTPVVTETDIAIVTPTREIRRDYEAGLAENEESDRTQRYVPEREPVVRSTRREMAQAQPIERPQPQPQVNEEPNYQPSPTRTVAQDTGSVEDTSDELPETAGFGALLALLGLGSLGASAAVRKMRKG